MGDFRLGPGEVVRADLTAPLRTLTFPALELFAITGAWWIGIGWIDAGHLPLDVHQRNLLVLGWMLVVCWRFLLPLVRSRRQRFIITNQRILVRAPKLRAPLDSIALRDVRGARRTRRGIALSLVGYQRPLFFPDVPKAKKAVALIEESRPAWPSVREW